METTTLKRSSMLQAKVLFAALNLLKENSGALPSGEVFAQLPQRDNFDEWESFIYDNGEARWQRNLKWYSVGCVKAGFIRKNKGTWYLTPEGEDALKLGAEGLLNAVVVAYREWDRQRQLEPPETGGGLIGEPSVPADALDEIQQRAAEGFKAFINAQNPYEFQDLVAALLRGMGYFTPFVAPRGKDGGVDVVAYRDPLGTVAPRIKIQIKHREASASVQEVRQLMGLLQRDGDVGIFVSTGGFTPDAKVTARTSHPHVELIDLERFVALWQEFYFKLTDEDKSKMPLIPIYFIAPSS